MADALPPKVFRDTNPPPPKKVRPKRVKATPKTILRKRAATQRKKEKVEASKRRRDAVNAVAKGALDTLAQEVLGPGGLTAQRKRALSEVLLGPGGGEVTVTNPTTLKVLLRKARERFLEHADRYMDAHIKVVEEAIGKGDLGLAANASQWAIDRLGDDEERVTAPPQTTKVVPASNNQQLNIAVPLGGMPQK